MAAKSKSSRGRQLQTGHLYLLAVGLAASLQENGADSAFEEFAAIRDLAEGRRQEQRGTERDALPEETSHLGKEAHPFTRPYLLTPFDPHPFPAGMCQRNRESTPVRAIWNVPLSQHGSFGVRPRGSSPEAAGCQRERLTARGQRLGGYPTNSDAFRRIVGNSEFLTRYDSVKSRYQAAKTRSQAAKTRSHAAKNPEYPGMAPSTFAAKS
ncbi:MAG: hypothetical protein OXB98_20530 [Bryobacterales bacterium]|nr:hypothetical protein [Bryobacterales bacterium]